MRWLRAVAGLAVLGLVLWHTGSGPLLHGVRAVGPGVLLLGALLQLVATLACAYRWRLVAGTLGLGLRPVEALAACYRAQLLNLLLPGGVLGDVHRGLRHGQHRGAVGAGLASVAWERVAGQVVQAVLLLVALLALPSPVRVPPTVLGVALLAVAAAVLAARRSGRGHPEAWPRLTVASTVAVTAHVATFGLAARAVGAGVPLSALAPLALLVLVVAGLPLSLAGWGPREGAAAWAFAAAGLGAGAGVATAAAYGVVVTLANLPGLAALVLRPQPGRPEPARPPGPQPQDAPLLTGGGDG